MKRTLALTFGMLSTSDQANLIPIIRKLVGNLASKHLKHRNFLEKAIYKRIFVYIAFRNVFAVTQQVDSINIESNFKIKDLQMVHSR